MNGHTAGAAAGIGGREGPPQVHMHQEQTPIPPSNNAAASTSNSNPNPMSIQSQTPSQPIQPALHNRSSSTHLSQRSMTFQPATNHPLTSVTADPVVTSREREASQEREGPADRSNSVPRSPSVQASEPPSSPWSFASVASTHLDFPPHNAAPSISDGDASPATSKWVIQHGTTGGASGAGNTTERRDTLQDVNELVSDIDLVRESMNVSGSISSGASEGPRPNGPPSPSISVQHPNLWLPGTHGDVGSKIGIGGIYFDGMIPRADSPISMAFEGALAEKRERPDPHAFAFKAPSGPDPPTSAYKSAGPQVASTDRAAVEQLNEHKPFETFGLSGNAPAFAPSEQSAQYQSSRLDNSISTEMVRPSPFESVPFSAAPGRFGPLGPTSAYSRATSNAQSYAPSSVDGGISYPLTNAGSTLAIKPPRFPNGQGRHRGSISLGPVLVLVGPFSGGASVFGGGLSYPPIPNALARPPSPRSHSRMSSYSSTRSFPTTSPPSPLTPPFGSDPITSGPMTHGIGLSIPDGARNPLGNGIGNGNVAPGPRSVPNALGLSGLPQMAHQHNLSQSSTSSQFSEPSTPISFQPLIRVLEKLPAQGLFVPLRSAVGSELRQGDPHVYDKLGGGTRKFKENASAAERAGLVVFIGGSLGKEKISLIK
ncbi:hypothetical protein DL93DRAFT_2085099 [Clavulina sp. PMI_390]|nr:hypothetical protein DL93DRAFT_2085099 [Clavulina sp. PMI_390]